MTKSIKDFSKEISALSNLPLSDAREFVETLGIYSTLAYAEGQPIEIPMIGTITIEYERDEITKSGRRAVVSTKFTPDDFLLRCIGQVEDGEETDAGKLYRNKIKKILSKHEK